MTAFKYNTLRDFIIEYSKQYRDKTVFELKNKSKELVSVSYEKLLNDIEALGTFLIRQGYEKQHIAIVSENSYDWARLFFAISFSGNVCVPISRESGSKVISDNLRNVDVSVVFYSKKCKKLIDSVIAENPQLIEKAFNMSDLDEYANEGMKLIADGDHCFWEKEVLPDDPAAIYFTSGTTGSQKGVILTQNSLVYDYQTAALNLHEAIKKQNHLLILPLTHTLGLVQLCNIFPYGAKVFICSGLKSFFIDITDVRPEVIYLVPLFLETVYKEVMIELESQNRTSSYKKLCKLSNFLLKLGIDVRPMFFKKIREKLGGNITTIISGGAPLSDSIIKEFHNWGIDVLFGYGITECSPIISASEYNDWIPGSVGKTFSGLEVIIDNPDENGIGEVCVKGPIVMKGYYNNPDETERVLRDGMFHTEDLGYLDSDGNLFLTGRNKNLIILSNGENISPEVLENKVSDLTIVKEVIVYQSEDLIVAEIFPNDSYIKKNSISDVQAYCDDQINEINKQFPAYSRIGKVVIRSEEFPKNASRKILRNQVGGNNNVR